MTKTSALLKGLVSSGLIWLLLQHVDVHTIVITIRSCKWHYLFLAVCMFALSKIISALRLNLFFGLSGINLSLALNLKLYLLGMYYNLFLPGGIGGDGYKIYFIKKKNDAKTGNIITAILLDRISGLFVLFCLLMTLSLFIDYFATYGYFIIAIMLLSSAAYYFTLCRFFPYIAPSFLHTALLSAAVQIFQLSSALFILLALKQSSDYTTYLFVFLVSSVIAVIPFTIGGIGARELTFLLGSQWLHLDTTISVAVSLLFFAITAAVSFWGIVYSIKGLSAIGVEKESPAPP